MNFARTCRHPVAWILLGFVLLNGLLCSAGHGRMLAFEQASTLLAANTTDVCGEHSSHGGAEPAGGLTHDRVMQLVMFECLFAGKVVGALVLIAGVLWRWRAFDAGMRVPPGPVPSAARRSSPGLVPQAP
jgi:hypothetical protein